MDYMSCLQQTFLKAVLIDSIFFLLKHIITLVIRVGIVQIAVALWIRINIINRLLSKGDRLLFHHLLSTNSS